LSRQQYLERDKDQVWLPAQMPAIPLAAGEKKSTWRWWQGDGLTATYTYWGY